MAPLPASLGGPGAASADLASGASLGGKFVSAGGSLFWVSADGTSKHEVSSEGACAFCGCSGAVLSVEGELVDSLSDGEAFSCSMVLGDRGRFIEAQGGTIVFWQEPGGLVRHPLPAKANCSACSCADKVETLTVAFVDSIPEGDEFTCKMMSGGEGLRTTRWLINASILCLLGPLCVAGFLYLRKRRWGAGNASVLGRGENEGDEEAATRKSIRACRRHV